ncbi:MAG TPA: signal peptide peptidase SppA [Phycisphaerae bacterium]|nr:signal peptide peptidase SppA [Phycisphaerae bacterium]
MERNLFFLLAVCGLAGWAGCGESAGFLVRPVTTDQRLRETVVESDPGIFLDKIALIDVEGLLINQRSSGLFGSGENPVSLLIEKLDRAADDDAVKAVVLRISSPGGTVQASEVLHDAVRRFRARTGKPVIACLTNVGASGAYYLACATGRIVAQRSTITGSIGVIIQTVNFVGTLKMLGVGTDAVVSGPMKTMGSPLKELTAEQRAILQTIVNEYYAQFVDVVDKGRPALDHDRVCALADGRVYTGCQALQLGLVDHLGTVHDAIGYAKADAGIRAAKVVMYRRPTGYRANVYSSTPLPMPMTQINLLNLPDADMLLLRRPNFLYLWSTDLPVAAREP